MKKRIFLSLFFCVALLGGYFRIAIIESLGNWAFPLIARYKESSLSYGSMVFEKGSFVMKDVTILDLRTDSNLSYRLEADQIELSLYLTKGNFLRNVAAKNLHLTFLKKGNQKASDEFSFPSLDLGALQVELGQIELIDLADPKSFKQSFVFTLQKQANQKALDARVYFSDDSYAQIDWVEDTNRNNFDFFFHKTQGKSLLEIIQFFDCKVSQDMQVLHGEIQGHFSTSFSKNILERFWVDLSIKDALIEHSAMKFASNQTHFRSTFERNELKKGSSLAEVLWPKWMQNVSVQMMVENGVFSSIYFPHCFENLQGNLSLSAGLGPRWDVQGECSLKEVSRSFKWEGKGYLYSQRESWLDSVLNFVGQEGSSSFSAKMKDLNLDTFEIVTNFQSLTPDVYSFFQPLLPFLKDWSFQSGVVSGDIVLSCRDENIERLRLYQVHADEIALASSSKDIQFFTSALTGSLDLNLTGQDIRKDLGAYFQCKEGLFSWNNQIHLEKIFTEFVIENGDVLPSYLSGNCHQVESRMTFLGPLNEVKIAIELEGAIHPIVTSLLGPDFSFPEEHLKAMIYYTHRDDICDFAGQVALQEERVSCDQLSFDFQFQRMKEPIQSFHDLILDGSIVFKELQLKKYDSLLSFLPILDWNGTISGKALFKPEDWAFSISGKDLGVKTPIFHVALPEIKVEDPLMFSFNPHQLSMESSLNLHGATCFLPKFDLQFESIYARASLTEQSVFIDIQDTISEQVSFEGRVLLDLNDMDAIELEVSTNRIEGSFNSADQFLSHFGVCLFENYPLKAQFISREQGFYLSTIFSDLYPGVHWGIQAQVLDGTYFVNKSVSLENLGADIVWKSKHNDFFLKNARANVVLSSETEEGKYVLYAPSVEKLGSCWTFDTRISNQTWDCLRLKGSLTEKDESMYLANLDAKKTHFFGTNFDVSKFEFDVDANCRLSLSAETNMEVFPHQLEFLQDCQVLSLLPEQLQKTMRGNLHLNVDIDTQNSSSFLAKGKNLKVGDHEVREFHVSAKKEKQNWNIEEFAWDDLKASLSLEKGNELWELGRLEASYKDLFSLKMAGTINNELFLDANIDELSVNLEGAKSLWGQDQFFVEKIEGVLLGQGHLIVHLVSQEVDAKLNFEAPHFQVHDLDLVNAGPISMSFSQPNGVSIQGLDFHFQDDDLEIEPFRFQVEKLVQHPSNQNWSLVNLNLILPKDAPQKLGDWFSLPFLSEEINLEKKLHIQTSGFINPLQKIWEFSSKELLLPLVGNTIYLQEILFKFDSTQCEVDLLHLKDGKISQIQSSIDLKEDIRGRVRLIEKDEFIQELEPLEVTWQYSQSKGLDLRSIQGNYCGLAASLYSVSKDPLNKLAFSGSLGIDFKRCRHLLSVDFQEVVDGLQMGAGFEFKGAVNVTKTKEPKVRWDGIFTGKQCEFFGFEFKTLLTQISYSENDLHMTGLKISDTAGILKIEELKVEARSDQDLHLTIPNLSVLELRPSLLKKPGKELGEIQPLVVRSFNIIDFDGNLNDSNSFTGYGSLSFINSFKRGYTVFDIPSDLLGRIFGVDQELLIPVQGEVDYQIHDGKFYLTALKDAFSLNKRSEFFFDPTWPMGSVGFDGNLEIYVKMKHYVLFKFTENFVLSIQGSLKDPDYELTRKKRAPTAL